MASRETGELLIRFDGGTAAQRSEFARELEEKLAAQDGVEKTELVRENPAAQDGGAALLLGVEASVVLYHLLSAAKDYREKRRMQNAGIEIVIYGDTRDGKIVIKGTQSEGERSRLLALMRKPLGTLTELLEQGESGIDGSQL